jgi:zeaxanthin glucosyltransferase
VFQTKPDTRKINGLPPFTSFYLSNGNWSGKMYSNFLWLLKLSKYRFNYLYNRTLSSGQDNFSILKKIGRDYNIDIKKRIEIKRSFGVGVKELSRIIISPAAFDFPHPEKEMVYRVGPLVDIKRDGNISEARYSILLARIEATKKDNNGFVVYCSLGTISSNFKKEVTKFFKKMVQVSKSNADYLFILSTGKDFNINDLYPIPDNLFVFDFVPQVNLLHYCDLMITHGGMNSITECIYNDVPMLIYPLSPHWDQPGNSARAVFHGLGLRGKIKKDSAKMISKKLNRIKSNHGYYLKNVTEMKKKFEEKNQSDEVLEIIHNMLN